MLPGHVAGKNFMRSSHGGACCGDRFLEVFTRRVLSQGHVVISFSDWFIFRSVAGTCRMNSSHEATLRLTGVYRCFVAATCPLNSNWFEFRGHVAGTKFRPRNKIFHENRAFTRWNLSRGLCSRNTSPRSIGWEPIRARVTSALLVLKWNV